MRRTVLVVPDSKINHRRGDSQADHQKQKAAPEKESQKPEQQRNQPAVPAGKHRCQNINNDQNADDPGNTAGPSSVASSHRQPPVSQLICSASGAGKAAYAL